MVYRIMSEHTHEHLPDNSHNLRVILILLGILAGMFILVFRPFGYRVFESSVGEHNIFAIILVFGIVGIVLVILQRLGIVFAERGQL